MRQLEELSSGMRVAEVVVMFEESVLRVHHLHAGQRFLVGESREAALCWPLAGDRLESPVRVSPSGALELCTTAALATSVELLDCERGATLSFVRELDTDLEVATLPEHARARIAFGEVSLLVGRTEAPRRRMLPPRIDLRAHATTAVVAVVFFLSLLAMNAIPPSGESLLIDPFALDGRIAHVALTPMVQPPSSGGAAPAGPAHTSSASGRPRSHFTTTAFAPHGAMAHSPKTLTERRASAEDAAANAGILGVIQAMDGATVGSVFGASSPFSDETKTIMGSLDGRFAEGGSGTGTLAGPGRGGGGGGTGYVGLGNVGRIGTGAGGGSGSGVCCGKGVGALAGRRAHAPELFKPDITVHGPIDREIIRRVVRHHLNEVKFCYEKELLKRPDLDGRVVTTFMIATDGRVASSSIMQSTMNNAAVEGCIAGAIRRWEFPRQSGGAALVTYPFAFHSAAEGGAEVLQQ
jgi:hypothetical protein